MTGPNYHHHLRDSDEEPPTHNELDTTLLVQNSYKQHNYSTPTARLILVRCLANTYARRTTNHNERRTTMKIYSVSTDDCVAFEMCNHK